MSRWQWSRSLSLVVASALVAVPAEAQRRSQAEVVFSESFSAQSGGTLRVDLPDSDVEIRSHSGSEVTVTVEIWSRDMEWAVGVFEGMDFQATATENGVRVTSRRPRYGRGSWRRNTGLGMLTRVAVPARYNLDIESSDGDIVVDSIEGTAMLYTSDGDVDMRVFRGPELRIETSDGDILLDFLDSPRASLRTSDGDIRIDRVAGAIEARTSDGDIDISLDAVRDVRLQTSDGDITIYAPSTLAASVDFQAEDLNVSRAFQITGRVVRRRIRGDMNGGGALLSATTNDGSVSLRPTR